MVVWAKSKVFGQLHGYKKQSFFSVLKQPIKYYNQFLIQKSKQWNMGLETCMFINVFP